MISPSLEESVEFAENPEPRCPCVLLLDTSGSMQGTPIVALNAGIRTFREELVKDSLAARRVEIAMIAFDSSVRVVQTFVTADQFRPPTLTAQGTTQMATAIQTTLDMLEERKKQYRANGISYYRPWVMMITDGEPHGETETVVRKAAQRLREDEKNQRVAFFAVAVQNADTVRLSQIVVRPPVRLDGLNFNEMFVWLSTSMQMTASAKVNEQIPLPPPGQVSKP